MECRIRLAHAGFHHHIRRRKPEMTDQSVLLEQVFISQADTILNLF
jgi:hypothetical protein